MGREDGEIVFKAYRVSFGEDEKVLEGIVVTVAQHGECNAPELYA